MQQLTEATTPEITAEDIDRAREAAHQARSEVKRFTALKDKAIEDRDFIAHERYASALETWIIQQDVRLINLANMLLDMYPEGARVS